MHARNTPNMLTPACTPESSGCPPRPAGSNGDRVFFLIPAVNSRHSLFIRHEERRRVNDCRNYDLSQTLRSTVPRDSCDSVSLDPCFL